MSSRKPQNPERREKRVSCAGCGDDNKVELRRCPECSKDVYLCDACHEYNPYCSEECQNR